MAVRFALATGAAIGMHSSFARKNYFYPDLPKGYQISQMDLPIVGTGEIIVTLDDGTEKRIGLTRAHLEEDAGKSIHDLFPGQTAIDLNRAGTPLLEIVSEPDMRSAREAVAYARHIHSLVRYIEICDGNMQEGSFRCDANVSVRPAGQESFGTRTEIKNLNSFRFLERAIDFEVERQIEIIEGGGKVVQETRLYDPERDETRSMRAKEEANDYRYFPDPDLPPLHLDEAFVEQVRATLPELPGARRERFETAFGLGAAEARQLVGERDAADYFETALVAAEPAPGNLANWMLGELQAQLNKTQTVIADSPVSAETFGTLVRRIDDGTISGKIGKQIFELLWKEGGSVDGIIAERGLEQISDTGEIEKMIDDVIAANPSQVEEYRGGKVKLLGFFVGAVMKASQGKANPQELNKLLREKLEP